jgi:hypothetical protein
MNFCWHPCTLYKRLKVLNLKSHGREVYERRFVSNHMTLRQPLHVLARVSIELCFGLQQNLQTDEQHISMKLALPYPTTFFIESKVLIQ